MSKGDDASPVVLQVTGVTKSFGSNLILDGITLTIRKGQTVCLLGPSGSGKSTLLRCVNWLERPDAGAVFLSNWRRFAPASAWCSSTSTCGPT